MLESGGSTEYIRSFKHTSEVFFSTFLGIVKSVSIFRNLPRPAASAAGGREAFMSAPSPMVPCPHVLTPVAPGQVPKQIPAHSSCPTGSLRFPLPPFCSLGSATSVYGSLCFEGSPNGAISCKDRQPQNHRGGQGRTQVWASSFSPSVFRFPGAMSLGPREVTPACRVFARLTAGPTHDHE